MRLYFYKRICAVSGSCPGYDLYKVDYKNKKVHYWSFIHKQWSALNMEYFMDYRKSKQKLIPMTREEIFLEIL